MVRGQPAPLPGPTEVAGTPEDGAEAEVAAEPAVQAA
jgi:hypothetical protein